jgi:streptogramin lyase
MRLFVLAIALSGIAAAETFTGVITDTMCGAKHTMMKDQPDDKCIKMCTKGSNEYALFDGQNVLKLSDQSKPAKFAAQKVKVIGTMDPKTKTIKVSAIEPL